MGRLIPAGTGFAHHEERRRSQEDILSEELKELEMSLTDDRESPAETAEVLAEKDVVESSSGRVAEVPAGTEEDGGKSIS